MSPESKISVCFSEISSGVVTLKANPAARKASCERHAPGGNMPIIVAMAMLAVTNVMR